MAQKGDLMTARSDIRVLDATIRDGGLVNNFMFSDDFINALYRTNVKAGVDYMEFGYKASKELFDVNKFGKWKFCDEESIREIVGDNNSDMKISVMADVGRCDYKKDIIDKKDSVIDMVRVATYVHQMPAAIEMIEDAKAKGYEVTCNIMAISNAKNPILTRHLKWSVKAAPMAFISWTVTVLFTRNRSVRLQINTPNLEKNTANTSVCMHTITSSLPLPTRSKHSPTVSVF